MRTPHTPRRRLTLDRRLRLMSRDDEHAAVSGHEGAELSALNLMGLTMSPTTGNGKICYLEIPAVDIKSSAKFYETVFSWRVRQRGDGKTAFDDTVGQVSGSWVLGRAPASEPGLLVYVMVDNVAATLDVIVANGGEVVQRPSKEVPEITARFRDPAGNLIGLYQEGV
ncbi:MAG: hypothetical protein NVS4B3_19040 [Gemmatimonadaceae bacterium]